MQFAKLSEIDGTVFPAGRRTQVLVGEKAPIKAQGFCQGRVTIFPGGKVPKHEHPNEEVYFVLEGAGTIEIDGKIEPIQAGEAVYVPSGCSHELANPSQNTHNMVFMFTYSPAGVVDHWKQEMEGKLK
jgi:mannose-6-phosphate isomerase-like protein (cupin superfamily)